MVQKDRNIKVTGERREQIDVHRLAHLLVRMARRETLDCGADACDPEAAAEALPEGRCSSKPE